ncbi:hypothetical protein E6P09_16560 (plasmid) [Haloferax mediterranei ATCC 33500]|uniref:DUF7305 domain-containing protein n=1 Tax=Haloferax mediterranei (strain ATCC 33500 / DSM 1411 / JCM 8866 / NBRC 14739 / NCIMB 2177 / R-4) TaxID=523841 RepID=I3RAY2_HALMT|nr:hypothetical protein [Haloferax mediterranei]AFK21392.1 hypothetical protein HFX_6269 [Haloferax mediterranei ATCC 33500]AHZ24535.1 hypothetical protein BM92_16640 [Haloferax mediterranei ATCC 33500]ELZ97287.1 hypothetical protein C439_18233 [Haloferax mediterranei ATCC 33500]MDX5990411.1 hypothetical protein [Haloferax mediterranei ATCC 33500]QCQ76931.1 hypothetical protein E6P09_16560 [Haloferax mediterranei ATCC 33500]
MILNVLKRRVFDTETDTDATTEERRYQIRATVPPPSGGGGDQKGNRRGGSRRSTNRRDDRAQSEVMGIALLIGIIVLAGTMLVIFGAAAVSEQEGTVATSQAERGFEQLDTRTSRVALGDASSQQVDLGFVDNVGHAYSNDEGWIRVTNHPADGNETEVTNTSLGTVFYQRDETTVAYQGGGVWRSDGEGSAMLSRPEFHYNDGTLTLPIVSVDGDSGLTDRVHITKNGTSVRKFPDSSRGLTNRLESGTTNVTVQSDYYEAWGQYFEENTRGVVTYNHSAEQVTVTFFALPDIRKFDVGIIATSDTGELSVEGTGAYIDSYDSSQGDYASTNSADGSIRSAGNVFTSGDALIDGDVAAGGVVDLDGNSNISGDVEWTKEPEPDATEKTKIDGNVTRIDGVDSVSPIDDFVEAYAERVRTDADNDETPHITNNELSISNSPAEIGTGDYYLHNMNLDDETLILNTTEGDVRIVVRDWAKLESGNLTVVGNGTVHLVVQSQNETTVNPTGLGSRDVNLHVGKKSDVHVPGEDANRLVLFAPRDFRATVAGSNSHRASFDGVIFAPAGSDGPGYVYVKQAHVYGLVMTGNLTAGQYGAIHYDRGLEDTLTGGSPLSELEYLHVAVHRTHIRSA